MTTQTFFPYRHSVVPLELDVEVEERDDIGRSSDGSWELFRADPDIIHAKFTLCVPDDLAPTVLPANEAAEQAIEYRIRWYSDESRTRGSEVVSSSNNWKHDVVLSKSDWVGSLTFTAVALRRDIEGSPSAGYAAATGSVLAESAPVRFLFDEPRMPPGAYLRTVWRHFASDDERWLREQPASYFALDPGEFPIVLYLNEDIPDLRRILDTKAGSGWRAAMRDSIFATIFHQVMSSLILQAVDSVWDSVRNEDQDFETAEDLRHFGEWHGQLVHRWLTRLYPDSGGTSLALNELLNGAKDEVAAEELRVRRLPKALQFSPPRAQRSRVAAIDKGFKSMVREISR